MALSEKIVFDALLRNHGFTKAELCRQANLDYRQMQNRSRRNTIHRMSLPDSMAMCRVLDISFDDLSALLIDALEGNYPDDYPLKEIKLPTADKTPYDTRSNVAVLSDSELRVVMEMREGEKRVYQRIVEQKQKNESHGK